jgi:predicted DNA-binding protein (MmcQ/YjbR family)
MKKIILTTLSCFILVICSVAQQKLSKEAEDFKSYTKVLENQRGTATDKKDYPEAIRLVTEWLNKYEHGSSDIKASGKGYHSGMYYNLACYQNLVGKKEAALNTLEKSIELGYSNYSGTLKDADFANLHENKRFKAALQLMREKWDMNYILKKSEPYRNEKIVGFPVFTYQSPDAPELVRLRKEFNLDSVAGKGDETSRIKNLLLWAHNSVRHDGGASNPPSRNASDLIAVCKKENRGVNCRMMATILRDAYQAEGFKSRVVSCNPKDTTDNDSHAITVVWSNTFDKWLWMDPTFNAYVSDKKGNLLSIEEVRERLINDSDLVLNEDANWNNQNKQTKEYYLGYYMSKNLYWIQCAVNSTWGVETYRENAPPVEYLNLFPGKFNTIKAWKKNGADRKSTGVSNPTYFWQKPVGK